MGELWMLLPSETSDNAVFAGNREKQLALVAFK